MPMFLASGLLLTSVLVVLLVLSIVSTVLLLLLLQSSFGFSLVLGWGTGLTTTSDWLPSVTGGCQQKPEVNSDDKRKTPGDDMYKDYFCLSFCEKWNEVITSQLIQDEAAILITGIHFYRCCVRVFIGRLDNFIGAGGGGLHQVAFPGGFGRLWRLMVTLLTLNEDKSKGGTTTKSILFTLCIGLHKKHVTRSALVICYLSFRFLVKLTALFPSWHFIYKHDCTHGWCYYITHKNQLLL